MFQLIPLNAKERKKIFNQLDEQFGCGTDVLRQYTIILNESSGRIYVLNEEAAGFGLEGVRVDAAGLYIGTLLNNREIRLSIEGSQLIGPHAAKNVLDLNDKEFAQWIRGQVLEKETDLKGFVIVRHGADFCGCGKPVLDEQRGPLVHNYIPKTRYVRSED